MPSFSTSVWGPPMWLTLTVIALGYPANPTYTDKRAAKEFIESLVHLIPCSICRDHYRQHLQANPISPSLDSRKDFFQWVVKLHNIVNKTLGKPEMTEVEVLYYISELGRRGRTPFWSIEDIKERDSRSMLYGFASGLAVAAIGVGGLWWAGRRE